MGDQANREGPIIKSGLLLYLSSCLSLGLLRLNVTMGRTVLLKLRPEEQVIEFANNITCGGDCGTTVKFSGIETEEVLPF